MPFYCLHTHTHTRAHRTVVSLHRLKLMVDPRACTPASLSIKPPLHHHSHTLLPSRPTDTLVLLPYIWSWADRQVLWPVVEGKWGAIMASPVQQEWQTWEWTLMAPDRPHGDKPANWSHRCVDVPPLVHSHCLWASRDKLRINGPWSSTDICLSLFPQVSFSFPPILSQSLTPLFSFDVFRSSWPLQLSHSCFPSPSLSGWVTCIFQRCAPPVGSISGL